MINKKRGWIRIVEAFTMILLLTGIFLVLFGDSYIVDDSQKIYKTEQEILRVIQLNNSLREDILNSGNLPIDWNVFPAALKARIISETPNPMFCKSKICSVNDYCFLPENIEQNIYTQEIMITSTVDFYSPRKLKLFCWRVS